MSPVRLVGPEVPRGAALIDCEMSPSVVGGVDDGANANWLFPAVKR